MFHKVLILSLGICTLASCVSQKNNPAGEQDSLQIQLAEGQQELLKKYPMLIKFTGIVEDNRCPKGVNCIWAGVAVASIEITDQTAKPISLNLATTDMEERGYQKSASSNGYTFLLHNVSPYPTAEQPAPSLKGTYKITITIRRNKTTSPD